MVYSIIDVILLLLVYFIRSLFCVNVYPFLVIWITRHLDLFLIDTYKKQRDQRHGKEEEEREESGTCKGKKKKRNKRVDKMKNKK